MSIPQVANLRSSRWTVEGDEVLARLFKQGRSASEAARILGVTRNAVIGRWHRMGLNKGGRSNGTGPGRPKRSKDVAGGSRERAPQALRIKPPPVMFFKRQQPAPLPRTEVPKPIPLDGFFFILDLKGPVISQCRFPIGQSEGQYHFCAHDVLEGRPFCAYHSSICYQPLRGETR